MSSLAVIGRNCIDLYPTEWGKPLADVEAFTKAVGGSATNVAIAAARLGMAVSLISRVGDDPLGEFVKREVARDGIDVTHVATTPGVQSVLTICEMFPPDDFPLYMWRSPTGPDLFISEQELPLGLIADADVFWATASGLARDPSRAAHVAAWRARGRVPLTVLDLDYRPMFWESAAAASDAVSPMIEHVTVAVGNAEECFIAVGETDAERSADALLERGVELAIVKRGPRGVLAKTRDERVEVEPTPVDVINGLGSGDAFGGALCHGLASGWSLKRTLTYANAAGAIVASRRECSGALPRMDEVEAFLTERQIAW
jgi:5-dehydro-2-deoxygluconokinase